MAGACRRRRVKQGGRGILALPSQLLCCQEPASAGAGLLAACSSCSFHCRLRCCFTTYICSALEISSVGLRLL